MRQNMQTDFVSGEERELLLSGFKILVVDDSPDILLAVATFLSQHGAKVLTAEDGSDAIRISLMQNPDLILMDMQLKKMDGDVATRTLRHNGVTIPIIALTGSAFCGSKDSRMLAGFTDYVAKPFDFQMLLSIVCRYIKMKRHS